MGFKLSIDSFLKDMVATMPTNINRKTGEPGRKYIETPR